MTALIIIIIISICIPWLFLIPASKLSRLTPEFDGHIFRTTEFQTRSAVAVIKSCSQGIIKLKTANGTDQAGAVTFKTCYI